jgi:cystathionine beta-lyase family protein involved in aluminum resistance
MFLPFAVSDRLRDAFTGALSDCEPRFRQVDELVLANQARVLAAFQAAQVSETDFGISTGYAYGDSGREKLERVFAGLFGAEAGLVRVQVASGTHAITLGLFGALRPGDELISAAGVPYDTLRTAIEGAPGSLTEWGVTHKVVPLTADQRVDLDGLTAAITPKTRVVFIQRSRGYALRPALSVAEIGRIIAAVKAVRSDIICLVDNCYGEFTETQEPGHVGADLVCGSLIKNPGGGIAPTGGYVVGRADLVEAAAARLTAPGVGSHIGANLGQQRLLWQGLFLAPHTVGEALRGAIFTAAFFSRLGFTVDPLPDAPRHDLVQAVQLGSPAGLVAFCRAVQHASPVDSHVRCDPWDMPGYTDQVIMAAGTFVMGSSLELSADGPMRPPYAAYFQGGLTREHVFLAALQAARALEEAGLLPG